MLFKVGDRVKVLSSTELDGSQHISQYSVGKEGRITEVYLNHEFPYEIDHYTCFHMGDLKLIEELQTGASKNDKLDAKPDLSLLPKSFNDQVAYCMMAGAMKYERGNYKKGHEITQLVSAVGRHVDLIKEGEDYDKDTSDRLKDGCTSIVSGIFTEGMGDNAPKILHWANIAACALMAIEQIKLGTIKDNREDCVIFSESVGDN